MYFYSFCIAFLHVVRNFGIEQFQKFMHNSCLNINVFHILDTLKILLSNYLCGLGCCNCTSSYSESSSSQQTDIDIYCRIIGIVGSIFINLVDSKKSLRKSISLLVISNSRKCCV